ncbi:MAG: hypothetical protein KA974_08930 [Saprospiraceae bacterium]|nr:hypothetical protein [Saprospiraceae bacterium]MBP7699798.1 hypothetical protein [Saprospiraceae bacterium]
MAESLDISAKWYGKIENEGTDLSMKRL